MSDLYSLAFLALYIIASLLVATFGRQRKWGFWGYLWSSLLMSPVIGLLFVLAGDTPQPRKRSTQSVSSSNTE